MDSWENLTLEKKYSRKKINFLEMKIFFEKVPKNIFGNFLKISKFSLKINTKISKKNRELFDFFPDFFSKIVFWFSMKILKFLTFKKNPKNIFSALFRKNIFHLKKLYFFLGYFFLMSNFPRNPKIILREPYDHYKIV